MNSILDENSKSQLKENNLILTLANKDELNEIIQLYKERMIWFEKQKINQWKDYFNANPIEKFISAIANQTYYVLKQKDQIVGAFELSTNNVPWDDEINDLYIHRLVTKLGTHNLGKIIIDICKSIALQQQMDKIRLICRMDNKRLNQIYDSYGFKFITNKKHGLYLYSLREYCI